MPGLCHIQVLDRNKMADLTMLNKKLDMWRIVVTIRYIHMDSLEDFNCYVPPALKL